MKKNKPEIEIDGNDIILRLPKFQGNPNIELYEYATIYNEKSTLTVIVQESKKSSFPINTRISTPKESKRIIYPSKIKTPRVRIIVEEDNDKEITKHEICNRK